MNSTISHSMPGAASAIQNSRLWRRRPSVPVLSPVLWRSPCLDSLAYGEPRLLPEGVRGGRELQLHDSAAEVGRQYRGGGEVRRQQSFLDQALGRDRRQRLHVAVEADVGQRVRHVEQVFQE